MAALLHTEQLSRHYGDLCAVDGISLELHAGEVLGFLGPNGAGKSTTMQMISGVLAPSQGSIHLNGINLLRDPLNAKRQLGYLPETPPLYPEMRVDEYLRHCARLHGLRGDEIASSVTRAKQRCALDTVSRRVIGQLSKGYRQRIGIAQAIIHQPRVLILDEPTSGLDPNQILEIRHLIRELARECAILLSTHILPEVKSVCDRVLILHQGKPVYRGVIGQQSRSLLVTLGSESEVECLEQIDGIESLEALGSQRFRLQLSSDLTPAALSREIVQQGASLNALEQDQDQLERIFSQVTLGEAGP